MIHCLPKDDDGENFQGSISHTLDEHFSEFDEEDFDEDLTDLESGDDRDSEGTRSACSQTQSKGSLTFVQLERDGCHEPMTAAGGYEKMKFFINRSAASLVAEVQRRREKDFGKRNIPVMPFFSPEKSHDSRCDHQINVSCSALKEINNSKRVCHTETRLPHNETLQLDKLSAADDDTHRAKQTAFDGLTAKSCSEETAPCLATDIRLNEATRYGDATGDSGTKDFPSSPLTPSIFPDHFPPTIHFPLPGEDCKCSRVE